MAATPLGEWTHRLGALLAEAYDCFMVGTLRGFNRIQAWFAGDCSWPMAGSPRIIEVQTTDHGSLPSCSFGQGHAFGGSEGATSSTLTARDDIRMLAAWVEQKNKQTRRKK